MDGHAVENARDGQVRRALHPEAGRVEGEVSKLAVELSTLLLWCRVSC